MSFPLPHNDRMKLVACVKDEDDRLVECGEDTPGHPPKIRSAPARAERMVVICWEIWFKGWLTCRE